MNRRILYDKIQLAQPAFPKNLLACDVKLISTMLVKEPEKRISLKAFIKSLEHILRD